MDAFEWICPYCEHAATIRGEDICINESRLTIENADGYRSLESVFIVCPNPQCGRFTLSAALREVVAVMAPDGFSGKVQKPGPIVRRWSLIPESKAKPFPNYIPKPILDDYREACLIAELSPRASATLSRRCLQGIIRDFWKGKIEPGKLKKEIEQLNGIVDDSTWAAIDGVRNVGNIGAHMEKDINVIVDVEPDEAQLLVELTEILLKDWYVAREQKRLHLEAIRTISSEKESARKVKKGKGRHS
jgi:hypothetical protein